jgi:pyruvate/2-oxoglutarate dehydrogenase complex dihydrolipoamide acyltransferase (E2) component
MVVWKFFYHNGGMGMHNIIERPIAVSGKVEIHPMMYVALSYDHRIIDGRNLLVFSCYQRSIRKSYGVITR